MTTGERIRQYRAKELISQQEFADRCGISKQTVYSIEKDLQEPSLLTLAKIEHVIGKEDEAGSEL